MSNVEVKLQESIRDTIVKLLMLPKIKKAINAAKKMVEEDPTTLTRLDTLKYDIEQLEDELETYCQRNPDVYICKSRNLPKARWK